MEDLAFRLHTVRSAGDLDVRDLHATALWGNARPVNKSME
jgi:hypothetical protein